MTSSCLAMSNRRSARCSGVRAAETWQSLPSGRLWRSTSGRRTSPPRVGYGCGWKPSRAEPTRPRSVSSTAGPSRWSGPEDDRVRVAIPDHVDPMQLVSNVVGCINRRYSMHSFDSSIRDPRCVRVVEFVLNVPIERADEHKRPFEIRQPAYLHSGRARSRSGRCMCCPQSLPRRC